MKPRTLITAASAALAIALLTGCQTAGRVVTSETSQVCDTCKNVTRTTPIAHLNYTRMECPSCLTKTVGTRYEYEEMKPDRVHTCTHCTTQSAQCPLCAGETL